MKKGGSGMGRSIAYLLMALLALAVGAYTLVSVMLGSNGLFVGNFLKISNRLWHVILFMLCLLSGMLLLLFAVGRGEKKRIGRLCKAAARAIDTLMHTRNERKAEMIASAAITENKNEMLAKKRFPRLCAMDHTEKETVISAKETTLSGLCEDFRNYAAYEKGLYYDKKTVRAFVSGLSVSHLMIIQGMSGTGKTSLACAFGDFLKRPASLIPVQPSWKEKTDLVGYYNEFTGIYNETELLATLYGAGRTDSVCITVLDEMNIARVEYYFAEFLSVLEMPDAKRRIIGITPSGMDGDPEGMTDGRLLLPENVWYIGTANNDDSTVAISDKVYDRASVITLDKRAFPFDAKRTEPRKLSYNELEGLFEGARRRYGLTLRSRRRIERFDAYLSENFGISFGNRIMHQLERLVPVYVACGGDELEAVDTVLAGKVLRKLGSKNPVFVRNSVSSLYGMLDELFGEGSMPSCRAALSVYGKNS